MEGSVNFASPIQQKEGKQVKSGTWISDSPTKKGRMKDMQEQEDERLQDEGSHMLDTIPDIDDLREEELTTQMAVPPSVSAARISAYKQLDKDLQKQAGVFTSEDGIDLSLFATVLSPLGDLEEDNKVWTFDTLFTEMSSDIDSLWRNATQEERNAV